MAPAGAGLSALNANQASDLNSGALGGRSPCRPSCALELKNLASIRRRKNPTAVGHDVYRQTSSAKDESVSV